jgi:hypothetical protein
MLESQERVGIAFEQNQHHRAIFQQSLENEKHHVIL